MARNSPRVGRTLIQRWWGEAIVAKVRLHVPVDYFRVADDPLGAPILGAMGCYRPGIGTIALPNTGRLGRHIRQLGVIQPNDVKPTYRD